MATTSSLNGLQSDKSAKRLKQISALRGLGIDNSIDLPQLVVCGDQSSGKSSVLEGLTGIPFPRDDGVCTRFPTEIIITHDETRPQTITASIIPFSNTHRPSETLKSLKDFNRSITTFEQLPKTIAEAGSLMGLRGYGEKNEDGPSFGRDVLQIKVSNQSGQHLSIVDLPGLISVASDVQTEADVEIVHQTVTSYIEKPRTIILAVVQAGNDIANQSIIKESKRFDKSGERTVGIITKPDLINLGTEARIAALANNKDTTKLQLGFFIVKNPSPLEIQAKITATEREANEQRFFQSPPWKGRLDTEKVGIIKLKQYLQKLLDSHIEKELPKVRHDMKTKIRTATDALAMLPVDRPTPADKRTFLTELADKYQRLLNAALNGEYGSTGGDFFAASGHDIGPTRLRALVHDVNTDFADYMREKGRTTFLRSKSSPSERVPAFPEKDKRTRRAPQPSIWTDDVRDNETQGHEQLHDWFENGVNGGPKVSDGSNAHGMNSSHDEGLYEVNSIYPEYDDEVIFLTEDEMKLWVLKVCLYPGTTFTGPSLTMPRCTADLEAKNCLGTSTPCS
jgi:GTPase SAR1 family protein